MGYGNYGVCDTCGKSAKTSAESVVPAGWYIKVSSDR
jgi:hypothetical protein